MSAVTFTPRPWEVGYHPAAGGYIVKPVLLGSRIKRVLPECEGGHVLLQEKGDADLIAAAPALYEALFELVDAIMDAQGNSGIPGFDPDRLDRASESALHTLRVARGEKP